MAKYGTGLYDVTAAGSSGGVSSGCSAGYTLNKARERSLELLARGVNATIWDGCSPIEDWQPGNEPLILALIEGRATCPTANGRDLELWDKAKRAEQRDAAYRRVPA